MLNKLFGSRLRAKVVGWLFSHPDESYFVRQLQGLLGEDPTNLSRELSRLAGMGILTLREAGREKYYQANRACPVYEELKGLAIKTSGVADVLRKALDPISTRIDAAFIYGSFARGEQDRNSDIDVMVIGSAAFSEVVHATSSTQMVLAREVNPTVYPVAEFRQKAQEGHHFITDVLSNPKIFLIGDERELAGLAGQRLAEEASDESPGNPEPSQPGRS